MITRSQHAEVATDLAEVVLHVDCQFKLGLYDPNQSALRYGAFSGRQTSECDKSVN